MKNNKGITLIALVITIILMMILVGITVTGVKNGRLFEYAAKAVRGTQSAKQDQIVKQAVILTKANNRYGKIEKEELQKALDDQIGGSGKAIIIDYDDEGYTVKFTEDNQYYGVANNGTSEQLQLTGGEKTLTVQCVNSKNTVLKEETYTIVKDHFSKTPPTVEGYEPANEKMTGTITENTTIKVPYYLVCKDDTTLVFTPLDSSGNVLTGENITDSSIASYIIGDGTTTGNNAMKATAKGIKSVLYVPDFYNGKPVKEIGRYAFRYCNSIVKVELGTQLTKLNDQALRIGGSLTTLIFKCDPAILLQNSLGTDFEDCTSLTNIQVKGFDNLYKVENESVIYTKDGETLVFCARGLRGTLIVPDGVKTIGKSSFSMCYLTSVVLPDSVTKLEQLSFRAGKIQEVTIGAGVKKPSNWNTMWNDIKTVIVNSETISSCNDDAGRILWNRTAIYIKEGLTVGTYLTSNYTPVAEEDNDKPGYVKYVKNV